MKGFFVVFLFWGVGPIATNCRHEYNLSYRGTIRIRSLIRRIIFRDWHTVTGTLFYTTSVNFWMVCTHWRCSRGGKWRTVFFLSFGATAPPWARASSFTRFLDHTQRLTTVSRTPVDEWSARHRDLYLTTHNTHNWQTSTPSVGFEPTISAGERPQTYALDRAATGTGDERYWVDKIMTLYNLSITHWFLSKKLIKACTWRTYLRYDIVFRRYLSN